MEFEPYQTTFSDVNKLQQPFPYQPSIFDGKRLRKRVQRKTVDYFGSVLRYIESRPWMKNPRKESCRLAAHFNYYLQLLPPAAYPSTPANAICTKLLRLFLYSVCLAVRHCLKYMPDGKRLITGLSSGEFTLWNALTFNFETILQAHDQAVRTMIWSHDSKWMLTADDSGCIKYWQSNMNNVKEFQAHECPLREAAFSPTDVKFVTGADDKKVKIFDFKTCQEERILEGHRSEIRCVDWHPKMGLVVSGGKDKLVKLWEPRSGQVVHTIKDHKNYVMKVKFNQNGNWFITACRDLLIHMYDVRMNKEVQVFSGHEKRITTIAWHPVLEKLFVSGAEKGDTPGEFGAIKYWLVGKETEAGGIQKAHEGHVFCIDWHPLGHILCSGSNDHATKFWTRNRPGDAMRDKYNLDIGEEDVLETVENDSSFSVPGLEGAAAVQHTWLKNGNRFGAHDKRTVPAASVKDRMAEPAHGAVNRAFFISGEPRGDPFMQPPVHAHAFYPPNHMGGIEHALSLPPYAPVFPSSLEFNARPHGYPQHFYAANALNNQPVYGGSGHALGVYRPLTADPMRPRPSPRPRRPGAPQ